MLDMGERLKKLRRENNLTQKQVGQRIGVAISAVSSYESGVRYPTYESLVKLSRLYNVTTDYLIGLSDRKLIDLSGLDEEEIILIKSMIEVLCKSKGIRESKCDMRNRKQEG